MRAGCLIIVLQWQRKCWMCWQLISVGAGQKGLKSPLHSQLWAQSKYFSKIENTLFGNSPINVGNQNGFVFMLAFECQILRGARNWALLTLDNVENIVLYQVTMSDQFQN